MKKTIFFWLFLCSFFSISYATKPMQFKFGDISMSDMEMKECPFDKDAPAIVLLDQTIGNLEITNSLFFVCEYHLRIKILKKSGLDYANYSFLISNNDRINKIKASTFNLEGGNIVETPVDNENIIKYKRSKYQNEMKIMFPKVSEGSIIELYYKIVTPNRYYPPNCYFQRDIPVAFGECYFDMSEYIVFKFFVNGDKNLFNDKNYKNLCDGRIFHFRVHDIPAFVPEKYMTSDVDNLLSINFEISDIKSYARNYEMTPTYGNLHQKLLANQYFGGELDHIDFLKKYTQEVIQNTNNYLERLKKIHSFIANKILWNDEMDYFPSKTLKETFNDESGNCADINLLLVAMLRQAGIVSYPVILSTRSNGKLNPIFCQLEKFNYLVAAAIVDGKTYLVDATEPTRPFNVLPFECLNDEGRAIDYTYNGWIKLRNDEKYSTNSLMTLKLKENGIIEGKVKNIYNGYDAYRLRELITTYTLDGYKAIVASNHPTWQIDSLEVSNVDSIDKQVIEVMNITVKDAYQILETNENSKKYVLTKVLFFSNQLENDFINVERKYPISFGCPIEEKYFFILEVPDNYELIDKKNDIKYMMPQNYGSYTYNLIQNGNFVQLKIKYELQKYDYNNSDYELIRKFQDQVVKKTNEVLLFDVK